MKLRYSEANAITQKVDDDDSRCPRPEKDRARPEKTDRSRFSGAVGSEVTKDLARLDRR